MTDAANVARSLVEELRLNVKVRSGEYCAVRAGLSLVVFYGKPMRELGELAKHLIETYLGFVPQGSIRSMLSASGVWRPFTKQGLGAGLRHLQADGADYSSIHISSGEPANVGEFGLHFYGSNFLEAQLRPRETCACILEFPIRLLDDDGAARFLQFVAQVADLGPFESGYAGLAFNHLSETWRSEALEWIAQRAPRFTAFDIGYDSLREVARQRVVNTSWVTLLSTPLVDELGGEARFRNELSAQIAIHPLKLGLMLVAGEYPPVGDVNRGATDIHLVKEVAALTKPVRARMALRFGSETFRAGWLNRLG